MRSGLILAFFEVSLVNKKVFASLFLMVSGYFLDEVDPDSSYV